MQTTQTHTVLCHKCGGALTGLPANTGLFTCGCISGWIRDWQVAIPISEAIPLQAKAKEWRENLRAEQVRNDRINHLFRREHHRKWYETPQPLEYIK